MTARASFTREIDVVDFAAAAVGGGTPQHVVRKRFTDAREAGTTAGKLGKVQAVNKTASTSGVSVDLYGDLDAFGVAINFAKVYLLHIKNTDATQTVTVSGNFMTLLGGTLPTFALGPQQGVTFESDPASDGWTVTATTGDTLTLTTGASTAAVEVVVYGR